MIQFLVDTAGIRPTGVERLRVDNHHANPAVRSEVLYILRATRIVDKWRDLMPVQLLKMVLGYFERFVHPFTDGNTWHDDDVLAPAILFMELIHGTDVGIRLPRARFHLYGKVIPGMRTCRTLDPLALVNLVPLLHFFYVV